MALVIYIDVLLVVNLYINYFLVRGTSIMLRRKVSPLRVILASAVGAVGSLLILVPDLNPILCVLIKIALGIGITFAAFGRQNKIDFIISSLSFLVVSFIFGGAMTALWNIAAPAGIFVRNGTAYFDIPIIAAALFTAALYGGFRVFRTIIDRRKPQSHAVVRIRNGAAEVTLDGLADTGNSLRDSFTGKPVVITSIGKVAEISPPQVTNYLNGCSEGLEGLRLAPCHTITSEGVVPVFSAEVLINEKPADVLVGVTREPISGADCIFDIKYASGGDTGVYYINGSESLPPPLTREEEEQAFKLLETDFAAARETLIVHNLRLVVYIAKKFENTGVGLDDLVSIGTIGLIKAVNTFSVNRNIKLATYASRCIENEILMYLRKTSQRRCEISIDEPLNVDWDGNELLLSDVLGTDSDCVNARIEDETEKKLLHDAVNHLTPRERQIMEMRFGLKGGREKTQKEVADEIGISQSYISRLEKRIIKQLREELERVCN